MAWDVVVVGAGLAGILCARRLQQAGQQVLVLEKSKGVGGRLATRRVNGQPADHGCRFLEPTSPILEALIQQLTEEQILQSWQPAHFSVSSSGDLDAQPLGRYFVAPEGMTAIAKRLAKDLEIQRQTRVTGLEFRTSPTATWQLAVESEALVSQPISAKAVVLAIPAPQAFAILQTIGDQIHPTLLQSLQQVTFNASISVMAGYNTLPLPKSLTQALQGWMVYGNEKTPFSWAGSDSSKRPHAQQPIVVIQSSNAFAQPYLQENDLDSAGYQLLEQSAQVLGEDLGKPEWIQVHRWRYATTAQITMDYPLVVENPLPLACCGDWCRGADTGAALESGWEIAERILDGMGLIEKAVLFNQLQL